MEQSRSNVITNPSQLVPGTWYACAFELDFAYADSAPGNFRAGEDLDWARATIARYDGGGAWVDELGDPVDGLWDPALQLLVATDAADAYMALS